MKLGSMRWLEEVVDLQDLVADDRGFGFDAAHQGAVGAGGD
ncbi:hypothetical protein [Thauera humireducens]